MRSTRDKKIFWEDEYCKNADMTNLSVGSSETLESCTSCFYETNKGVSPKQHYFSFKDGVCQEQPSTIYKGEILEETDKMIEDAGSVVYRYLGYDEI